MEPIERDSRVDGGSIKHVRRNPASDALDSFRGVLESGLRSAQHDHVSATRPRCDSSREADAELAPMMTTV
jgi:hypothetical protein